MKSRHFPEGLPIIIYVSPSRSLQICMPYTPTIRVPYKAKLDSSSKKTSADTVLPIPFPLRMTQLSGLGELRPRNGSHLNREIGSLVNYLRRLEFDPNTFVILVCRHIAIEGLTDKIHHKTQEKALGRFKSEPSIRPSKQ